MSIAAYSQDDLTELLALGYSDLSVFGKTFFPERYPREFDVIHSRMFDLLSDRKSHLKVIAAPRGIGKTSIANLLLPSYFTLYNMTNYIVPVSSTSTVAEQQSENLKMELTGNPHIKALFGDLRSDQFNKEQWVARINGVQPHEVCVQPRGAGQQVRGMIYRNWRPHKIIVDDLENPEDVNNEELRNKTKEWFYGSLMNVVDRGRDDWEIIVVGTVLHHGSLLEELLSNPDWESERLELCDDDFKSNAPHFMDDDACRALYQQFVRAEKLETWFREYRNKPTVGGEDAAWKPEFFHRYSEYGWSLNDNPNVDTIIITDPAKSKQGKARTAIVAQAVDYESGRIYTRDIIDDHLHPDEVISQTIDMAIRLKAKAIAIEVTGLNEFVTYPLRNALSQRGVILPVIELHARAGIGEKGKTTRVRSLLPFYRTGMVYHNETIAHKIESQLLQFPNAKYWDVMDAAAYIAQILEEGQRYMGGFNLAPVQEYNKAQIEAEFAKIQGSPSQALNNFRIL